MSLFSKKTLPSTDPAGAAYAVEKTDEEWREELTPPSTRCCARPAPSRLPR